MSRELNTFEKRAQSVRELVTEHKGIAPDGEQFAAVAKKDSATIKDIDALRENMLLDMRTAVKQVDSLRAGSKDRRAVDVGFSEFVKETWGFASSDNGQMDSFYSALNINPAQHTLDHLMSMPDFDDGYRWLIPEIIREAVRGGLRRSPLYVNLIAAEETVSQPTVILPSINMSDAMPKEIGESETIPTGTVSFGQKSVGLQKIGTGIKITDEVTQFVSLNILSLYMEDVGVKINIAQDTILIDTLINGDGNANASPVIGVTTVGTWTYKDLLRAWIRLGLIGRLPQGILSNENPALDILMLPEFKGYGTGIGPVSGNQIPKVPSINLRTPVPTNQNYDIHGAMPANNQIMLIDANSAAIKLNASAMRVESSRIAERQISGTYITMVTGFAKLFDDSTLIIDKSLDFAVQGFPTWMSPLATQTQRYKK